MQVSVEATGSIQRKMTVSVPAERINGEVDKRLKKMRGQVRLDGFRPGKVPLSIVKKRYSLDVLQDVASDMIESSFADAVQEKQQYIAGQPAIRPLSMGLDTALEYEATYEVYPEIELQSVEGVAISKPQVEINEADVDQMIETLRAQRKVWSDVEREATIGDRLTIDFLGRVDGEAFEGGASEDYQVTLGEHTMLEDFEKALEGMKAGEEKVADVAFPDNYQAEQLKGKTAQFELRVKKVEVSSLPEVDAEFINHFEEGVEDLASFREKVKENMQNELSNVINMQVKTQVMNTLHDLHDFDVPQSLIEQEIKQLRQEMNQNTGVKTDDLPNELFTEQAKRRVKLGLTVGELIKVHQLETDKDQVEAKLLQLSSTYEDPDAMINMYRGMPEAMQTIEAAVMEDMIVGWVLSQATITLEPQSFDEVMKSARQ
ncbi:MAG TPA: trigger factor [Thiothrix sp.]|nr:trigger factor [Thiothrix sp.]